MSSDEMSDTNLSVKDNIAKDPVGHKALPWHQDHIVKLVAAVRTQDIAEHVEAFDQVYIDWDSVALKVGFPADKCHQKWKSLLCNVRHFRTLSEVALDVLVAHSKMKLANKPRLIESSLRRKGVVECYVKAVMEMYKEVLSQVKVEAGSKKLKMNPDHPKKPRINGYSIFCSENMSSIHLKGTDLMRKIGQMWRDLSRVERDNYNLLSKKEKEEYLDKLHTYYEDHPEDDEIQKIIDEEKGKSHNKSSIARLKKRKLSKTEHVENLNESVQEHTEYEMDPASPALPKRSKKKRARSRFTAEDAYVKEKTNSYRQNHPDYEQEKVDTKLRHKFAKLSDRKKEKYHQMAANMSGDDAS